MHIKKPLLLLVVLLLHLVSFAQKAIPYGDNTSVGKYITLNGVKHYYEVYGAGAPMLLIHGNVTGIKGWAAQIDYFSKKYKVYAIDCRGRGRSDLGKDTLTYMQQAKDIAAFISQQHLDSVAIIGKSDGGIIGILLGIHYPEHIKKIVAFGANMWPDSTALYPSCVTDVHSERTEADRMLAKGDTTQNWYLVQQRNRMMEFQPHITPADLQKIKTPVLIMSCDRDLIREEHTLFIYQHIPNANLAILPGESHHIARQNPELFNATIDKYLSEPFKGDGYRYKQ